MLCQEPGKARSSQYFSVLLHPKEGTPPHMKQVLYHFSLYFHLQETLILD